MYFEIKSKKGRDYIQLRDGRYLHHIGPATLENLALTVYLVGLNNAFKLYRQMREYFAKKENPDSEKVASAIARFYKSGFLGLKAGSIGDLSEEEFSNRALALTDKIEIYGLLEEQFKKQFADNPHVDVKKLVPTIYKEASEDQRAQWLKELQEQREKILELLS